MEGISTKSFASSPKTGCPWLVLTNTGTITRFERAFIAGGVPSLCCATPSSWVICSNEIDSMTQMVAYAWQTRKSEKSYKSECQEKNLPIGSVPRLFSRHSAPMIERALSIREWSSADLMCVSSRVVPFRYRDGAQCFLKQQA